MPEAAPKKKKIAVLGGGMGSLTTVWELTSQPNWEALYDITVYQLGWRLGGKGASGRNMKPFQGATGFVNEVEEAIKEEGIAPNYRIEEHGLHIFFGFYENAFRIMKEAYEGMGYDGPFQSIEDGFKPHNFIVLLENYKGRWTPWNIEFPKNDLVPWEGGATDSILKHIVTTFRCMYRIWNESPELKSESWLFDDRQQSNNWLLRFLIKLTKLRYWDLIPVVLPALPFGPFFLVQSLVEKPLRLIEAKWYKRRLQELEEIFKEKPVLNSGGGLLLFALQIACFAVTDIENGDKEFLKLYTDVLLKILEAFRILMEPIYKNEQLLDNDNLRRRLILLNFAASGLRGLLADEVIFKGSFDCLDEYNYGEWLRKHGALEMTLEAPIVRMIYDQSYSYEQGDVNRPRLAAGVALRIIVKEFFEYNGAIMWKMQASMGDTVFTPIYEVLKRRGVKFKFFHNVTNIGLSEDKKSIDNIKIKVQATVKDNKEYEPLIEVKRLRCWPAEPLYDQLEQGEELKKLTEEDPDNNPLESFWSTWEAVNEITLKAEEDFDIVVLGISIAALPYICPELIDTSLAWQNMVNNVKTVNTQGGQIWLKDTLSELGWQKHSPVLGSYAEPLDTYADMSYLIEKENWQSNDYPYNLSYFTGVLRDPGIPLQSDSQFPRKEQEKIDKTAIYFLENKMGYLWPDATTLENPRGLDWNLLIDPNNCEGADRFYSQYWRINISPTERYVLSVPGSIKYRLKADESGFDRLYLTGDWINNGLNVGAIEPTVISGMQTARAILEQEFRVKYTQKIIHERDFFL